MKQPTRQNKEHALALKVDVDTYIGMKRGVPRLLSTLARFGVKATFFLSMGPDASGRAVFQLIKNPRFLRKMMRTNAGRLYGIRTALYGTILPSPMVALAFPELVRRILSEGHEVEFHAWDHRRWQDDLLTHSSAWIEEWFQKGITAYTKLVGGKPSSFGAPGWLIDDRALETAGKHGFAYLSCTRAQKPFIHEVSGLMEIPSDLPCLEEVGVDTFVPTILNILKDGGIHVLPVHAEAEGGIWNEHFTQLLAEILDTDYRIVPLSAIKNILQPEILPVKKHRMELLPGRSAVCAV
ncbi:MAG: polysaccharide deacetylase family protein [Thermodesulfobacteriota bacterium]|nr:polysaccharide deacetylase family protein [Thermodesulfobacteriota bacterium]